MARPRKFDEQKTLAAVMRVFWHQGYDGTSVNDLITATGLKPGSLYAAFSNKRNLFLLSIDAYTRTLETALEQVFNSELPAKTQIKQFYDFLIKESEKDSPGCFLVNSLFEANQQDHDILEKLGTIFGHLEARFSDLCRQAQREGTLREGLQPELAGKLMVSYIYSIRGYSKLHPQNDTLQKIKRQMLVALFKK